MEVAFAALVQLVFGVAPGGELHGQEEQPKSDSSESFYERRDMPPQPWELEVPPSDNPKSYWTPERVEELRRWVPGLGGLRPGEFSAQEFVDRPAYRWFYIAHEHALKTLEEALRTHFDWSVRASAALLLAQLPTRRRVVKKLLQTAYRADADETVRALAAQALKKFFGECEPIREVFPEEDAEGNPIEAPRQDALRKLVESMCSVSPQLTQAELDILIPDLLFYLEQQSPDQINRNLIRVRSANFETPANRLFHLGKAGYDAVIGLYWQTDKAWVKENVLTFLGSDEFRRRDEQWFRVLEDAVRNEDQYIRLQVAMCVRRDEDARTESIRRQLAFDPWERIRRHVEIQYVGIQKSREARELEAQERARREEENRFYEQLRAQIEREREEAERRLDNFEPLTWKHVLKQDWYRTAGPNEWLNMKNSLSPEEWAEVLAAAEEVGVRITLPPEETAQQQTTGKPMTTAPPPKNSEITGSSWKLAVGLGLPFVAILLAFLLRPRKA